MVPAYKAVKPEMTKERWLGCVTALGRCCVGADQPACCLHWESFLHLIGKNHSILSPPSFQLERFNPIKT